MSINIRNAIDNQEISNLKMLNINDLCSPYDELDGFSPVLYASANNKADVIELFYNLGVDLTSYDDYYDTSARIQAAVHNSIDVLKKMHEFNIDIISNKSSLLFDCKISYIAIEYGALETIKYFHSLGEDFSKKEIIGDFQGESGIDLAIRVGNQDIVEFFRSIGYDVIQAEKDFFGLKLIDSVNSNEIESAKHFILKGATIYDHCLNFANQIFLEEILNFCKEEEKKQNDTNIETLRIVIDKINQLKKNFLIYSLVSSMSKNYDFNQTIALLMKGATITDNCFDFIFQKLSKGKKIRQRSLFTRDLLDFCTEKIKTHDSFLYFNHLIKYDKFKVNINIITNKINNFIGSDPNIDIYKKNLLIIKDKINVHAKYKY